MSADGRQQRPRVLIVGPRALYLGPGLGLAPHRSAVATLAVALDDDFELTNLEPGATGGPERRRMALILPIQLHHLRPQGDMAFLYLDALGDEFGALGGALHHGAATEPVIAHLRCLRWKDKVTADDLDGFLQWLGIRRRPPVTVALTELVRTIDRRPQDVGGVAEAARRVGLSASRFQARLRAATGVPYRRYRRWRRMAVVAEGLSAGATLTDAALMAGFASSAHFSTAFRGMFGFKPSLLLSLNTEFQVLDAASLRTMPREVDNSTKVETHS